MKKFIVFPLILLLLCGCSQKKQVTPILDNISFVAKITYNDEKYECDSVINNNVLNLVVSQPEEIKDLSLTLDQNGVEANFKGVSFTPDVDSFPQGALAQILFDIFTDISENKKADLKDDNCVINGKIDEHEYIFTFAPSGLPIRLTINDLDFVVEFNNVTIL